MPLIAHRISDCNDSNHKLLYFASYKTSRWTQHVPLVYYPSHCVTLIMLQISTCLFANRSLHVSVCEILSPTVFKLQLHHNNNKLSARLFSYHHPRLRRLIPFVMSSLHEVSKMNVSVRLSACITSNTINGFRFNITRPEIHMKR